MIRRFLRTLTFAMLTALTSSPSPASTDAKQAHIVMVTPRGVHAAESAFMSYLREQGVSARYTVLTNYRAPRLQRHLHSLHPDLIYVWGTPASLAVLGRFQARKRSPGIRDIPVVLVEVASPVGSHILSQLSAVGGNVTGVIHIAPLAAQLAAMRLFRPFSKLGYIVNPAEPNTVTIGADLADMARRDHFELIQRTLRLRHDGLPDSTSIDAVVKEISEAGVDYLYVGPSTFLAFSNRDRLTRAALRVHLPTFCATQSIVRESGCLFGLVSDETDVGRFAGRKAVQILTHGVPPKGIPVEFLHRYTVLINLDVAESLNTYPSLELLIIARINRYARHRP